MEASQVAHVTQHCFNMASITTNDNNSIQTILIQIQASIWAYTSFLEWSVPPDTSNQDFLTCKIWKKYEKILGFYQILLINL